MKRYLLLALGILALLPLSGAADEPFDLLFKGMKKEEKNKATVAVFRLKGSVTETPADDLFSFSGATSISLKDLVARLRKAADDSSVQAVVILPGDAAIGWAQMEEVLQAMKKVRDASKDVYLHAESMSLKQYVLASGATRISAVPTTDLWITGLYGEAPYVRGLLNLVGVKPDFLTCGDYKSAAEIFTREGPSPQAEKMQNWLLDSLFETQIKQIAKGRGVEVGKVKEWINHGPYSAEKAKELGIIDAVEHRQDFEAMLKKKYGDAIAFDRKYGQKAQPKMDLSSPFAMFKIMGDLLGEGTKKKSTKPAVAIVYVDGEIMQGGGSGSPLDSEAARSTDLRRALDEAARDDTIKAVVLRIDSPGGSALASEIILDATKRVKAKKPLVVSMGNVAGSGGYYVACGADTIFADESTITGSIGVVSGKMVTNDMWKKIGVTFKAYKRGENAGMLSSSDLFSKSERERMQALMDDIYKVFKDHVVAIRGNRLKKPIDEIAGGRVYTGQQALELGLVDKIGTLQDAILFAANEAKLKEKEYEVRIVPEPKNFLERLLEELSGDKDEPKGLHANAQLANGKTWSLVNLALPYLQNLDPQRVQAIKAALRQLQLIQQEGVIMAMPQMTIRN